MPPASLSTLAVIIPGPTTARNSRVRPFQRFRSLMRAFHKHIAEDECPTGCVLAKSGTRSRTRINALTDFEQRKSAGRVNKRAKAEFLSGLGERKAFRGGRGERPRSAPRRAFR